MRLLEPPRNFFVHAREFIHWHSRRDAGHNRWQLTSQERCAPCSHHHVHRSSEPVPCAGRHLRHRKIERRLDLPVESLCAHISDNSHTLVPNRIHAPFWPILATCEALPDGILIWP